MKRTSTTRGISEAVVAYCDAIDVPAFDERILASSPRRDAIPRMATRRRPWVAGAVAAIVVLLAVLFTLPGVVAGVERVFAAFTVASPGRAMPMTIRQVDLAEARAAVPFPVIAPPAIASAPDVTIEEVSPDTSAADASIVFELHGTAPGLEVMIVESATTRERTPTLFTVRRPQGDAVPPSVPPIEPPEAGHPATTLLLRNGSVRRAPAPASWVVRGTRIAVMSPPGFLTKAQLQSIRDAMSR